MNNFLRRELKIENCKRKIILKHSTFIIPMAD
jgi:hypothetical protein